MIRYTLLLLFILSSFSSYCQEKDTIEKFGYHIQQTLVGQSASADSLTARQAQGHNSFSDPNLKISLSATFYLGFKLWKYGSLYVNPDIAGGAGLGGTLGVAGYMNGEIFRVGNPAPSLYVSRMFIRQYFPIGDTAHYQEPGANQLGEMIPEKRIQLTIGKFTLADMFDNNHYSHDPRTRFLNWSLMNAGAYDFASNTKGYTYATAVEYITPTLSARAAVGLEPQYSNGPITTSRNSATLDMEASIVNQGYGLNFEIEKPIKLKTGKVATIRLLYFINRVDAGKYTDAIAKIDSFRNAGIDTFRDNASNTLASSRKFNALKYGFSLNVELPIGKHAGMFSRLSWNDGKTESFAFAEIDRSASLGFVLHGTAFNRYHDRIEIAGVVNGISKDHRDYLTAGEYGFMLGEPGFTYKPECIIEFQYVYDLGKNFEVSPDYQLIMNPGYDQHRGAIHVFGLRTHIEF